jgi:hypothetical protein
MGMNSTTSDHQTTTAISLSSAAAEKKKSFVLTRKNQKGQVAIFVALIFQVVFVFFALMINVGLLIHHKINLQHSTDLAAYYGAMKQAEQFNAIAHINFQMRQAWKLLTWRYRVLGTFGFSKSSTGAPSQSFAFEQTGIAPNFEFKYHGALGIHASQSAPYVNGHPSSNPTMNCAIANNPDFMVDGAPVGIQDIPFFCSAHAGFSGYPQAESNCQVNCDQYANAKTISLLPGLGSSYITPFGGNLANVVNGTINNVNNNILSRCEKIGPAGALNLGRFIAAFNAESVARKEAIKLLASNLSLDSDSILDLEGQPIKLGAKRTFQNNLTGANFTGLDGDASFQVYNGFSQGDCRFRNGDPDDGRQFLKRIEFKIISYFLLNCNPAGAAVYFPDGVYNDAGLSSAFAHSSIPPDLRDAVANMLNPQNLHTIGFEKNPNCVDYYAVKTYSNPTIPFLPLSKIKLQAVAIAKPFGGSIGPWYGTQWDVTDPKSRYNDTLPDTKMDPTLPMRDYVGEPNAKLIRSVYSQPNFSLFVGDRLGLRNLDYLAAFHSALAVRDINDYPGTNSSSARNNTQKIQNTSAWPAYLNWDDILSYGSSDFRNWDTLASKENDPATGVSQGGMRALEIAAIAPNQYDIFHYSIDPDFYNNYYIKFYKGFDNLKTATGGFTTINKNQLRPDFGAKDVDETGGPSQPLSLRTFSVKDQILLKNQVLDVRPTYFGNAGSGLPLGSTGDKYGELMNFLVTVQSSLLTGWTFLRFNDYVTFPNGTVNKNENTMSFGQCDDPWNKTSSALGAITNPQSFETPLSVNSDYPGASGNCVTGGRSGYSVKIIAPTQVDGTDTNVKLANPIDPSFLQF